MKIPYLVQLCSPHLSKVFSKESNSKGLEARLTEDSPREARSEKTEASEAEAEEAPEAKE